MVKAGVLLANLGTPEAPDTKGIKTFLSEFLHDYRVVDLTRWLWCPLLHFVILPIRSPKVARSYRKIWTDQGSPLRKYSQQQRHALETALKQEGVDIPVALGMRYGKPSIIEAWQVLKAQKVNRVILLPLYPQYSMSTTASVFDQWARVMRTEAHIPTLRSINSYHKNPQYIQALVSRVQNYWQENGRAEHFLMSFHGIPQRFVAQGDPYQQQCETTAKLLAQVLSLQDDQWSLAYQSRFGREPWLRPYVDEQIKHLARQGVQSLDVICPGFSCDCLETLEEVNISYKNLFLSLGGQHFGYVPALNEHATHIRMMVDLVCREIG